MIIPTPAGPAQTGLWVEDFIDWLELVKGGVGGHAIAEYADHLRRPGHLSASYEYFRAFPRDVEDTIRNRGTTLAMPVLAIGGQGALGQVVPDQAQAYAKNVTESPWRVAVRDGPDRWGRGRGGSTA